MPAPEPLAPLPHRFSDERNCAEHLIALRWSEGFVCPRCGGRRASPLTSRADTFECLDCGRQTSVIAGTLMHRSKLSLRQWYQAIHAFANRRESVSVTQLGRSLGIGRNSASLLKRKLDQLINKARHGTLEGRVAIVDGEVRLRSGERCTIVAVREETSGRIRAAALPDASIDRIETFLAANVAHGATLLYRSRKYRLPGNYDNEFIGLGSAADLTEKLFENVVYIYQFEPMRIEYLDKQTFVIQQNPGRELRPVSFEDLLKLIVTEAPTSYWEMRDGQNPRRGKPTERRSPRRRKTANGMRQDRPSKRNNPGPAPAL